MMRDEYPYAPGPGAKLWQPAPLDECGESGTSALPPSIGAEFCPVPVCNGDRGAPPSLNWIIGVTMVVLLVGNATLVPVGDSRPPIPDTTFVILTCYISAVAGSMAGQVALLSILIVWSQGPLWRRQLSYWALAILAVGAGIAGSTAFHWEDIAASRYPMDDTFELLCALPFIAVSSQSLLWLLKLYGGWNLAGPGRQVITPVQRRLSIRDFATGTVFVAVATAGLRYGQPQQAVGEYWVGNAIALAVILLATLLLVLPNIYSIFRIRRASWALAAIVLHAVILTAVTSYFLQRFRPAPLGTGEIAAIIACLSLGYTASVSMPLLVARAYGYRLTGQGTATVNTDD